MMNESEQPAAPETPASTPIETTESIRDITEITSSPSQELIDKFSADLEGSQCDTPETAVRAAEVYHNAFEAIELGSASLAELELATESITAKLAESRAQLSFGDLPHNYSELAADIKTNEPSLPLETYQAALEEVGIDAIYSWEYNPREHRIHELPLPSDTVALPSVELADSTDAKRAAFATINAQAMIPKEVIEMTDGLKVFYGDILGSPDVLGSASVIGFSERINIDITDMGRGARGYTSYSETIGHELYHIIYMKQLAICGDELDQAFVRQYPTGFSPNDTAKDTLQNISSIEGNLTSLANLAEIERHGNPVPSDLEVIAANPYAASDHREATASLIGESLLSTYNTDRLYIAPDMSETIYNQLAIGVARFNEASPLVAEFYTNVLQAAAIEKATTSRLTASLYADNHAEYEALQRLVERLNQAQTGLPSAE